MNSQVIIQLTSIELINLLPLSSDDRNRMIWKFKYIKKIGRNLECRCVLRESGNLSFVSFATYSENENSFYKSTRMFSHLKEYTINPNVLKLSNL